MCDLHGTEIGFGRQDVTLMRLLTAFGGRKLKIQIKSDSYAFQSYARILLFDPGTSKWNSLADIHYSNMATESGLIYTRAGQDKTITVLDFKDDIDSLMSQAGAILT